MTKIAWCLKQKKGIELVEPNDNLSKAYFQDADDSLDVMREAKGKWKSIIAYYACYYALYAILMKAGLKCEIHDCTLELMAFFGFSQNQIEFMKKLKKERTDVQYYRKEPGELNHKKVAEFVMNCKEICSGLDHDLIIKIRGVVKND